MYLETREEHYVLWNWSDKRVVSQHDVAGKSNPGPLQKQPVPLTTEPSLVSRVILKLVLKVSFKRDRISDFLQC